jgi:hypothetical protein
LCNKLERVAFEAGHFERSEKCVLKQISPFAQKPPLFSSDTIKPVGAATVRRSIAIGIFLSFSLFYLPSGVVLVWILC